jgi:glyoxylate/hydroxypyruvate reductase
MAIVIASDIKNIQPWIDALKKNDPAPEVIMIDQVEDPSQVEFVLAWNYPHGLLNKYPRLKTVSSMGAGVDHIVADPTLPEGINIVRIIDQRMSDDMYEFTLAAIMNRLRMLTHYREKQMEGIWKKKRYLRISEVRVGVMGAGKIGNHIAEKLDSAGFRVSGWKKSPASSTRYKIYHGDGQLTNFLAGSDILICLLPLTPETEGILNRENLQLLPQNAWIINIGRGGHVVDKDLVSLLDSGHLAGANLDVFRDEPLPSGHPFWNHNKIYLTPHIASLPLPESVAPQIVENYLNTINGRPLVNKIDRENGY